MDPLALVLLSLQSLSLVLRNPALGGGSQVQLGHAADITLALAAAIAQGEQGYEQLKTLTTLIQSMADEHRGPRPDEWADLIARRDAAHETLQEMKRQILAGEAGQLPQPAPPPQHVLVPADPKPPQEVSGSSEPTQSTGPTDSVSGTTQE